MAALLLVFVSTPFSLRWLPVALVCWAIVVWQCARRLDRNCSADGEVRYATFGLGTQVTLLRGLCIAATAGFLPTVRITVTPLLYYVPAALYTVAAFGDALDGYLARRQQHTTLLGQEMDTALDALGLVVAPLLAVLYGKLYTSYLLVSVAYYIFMGGLHWRRRHGLPVYPLPPSRTRRLLAGFQMGLVATVLWPPLIAEVTRVVGFLYMLPLLTGFVRDWLYVSGRRQPGPEPLP